MDRATISPTEDRASLWWNSKMLSTKVVSDLVYGVATGIGNDLLLTTNVTFSSLFSFIVYIKNHCDIMGHSMLCFVLLYYRMFCYVILFYGILLYRMVWYSRLWCVQSTYTVCPSLCIMYTWYVYKVFCDDVSSVSQWNTRESSFILMFDADNLTIVCEIIAYVLHTAFFSVYIRKC